MRYMATVEAKNRVQTTLESQEWKFARTAVKNNPPWYTLRKSWENCEQFQEVALYIREHGVVERYRGHRYIVLSLGGYAYWTMGFPIDPDPNAPSSRNTILINRKELKT
jgi:hypothetical protein